MTPGAAGIDREPEPEILAEGLAHPEGPDLLPDGRVIFVNGFEGEIAVWHPESGRDRYAYTGGAPHACCLGADGCVYVTQSPTIAEWTAPDGRPPSIQRVTPEGEVEIVCTEVGGRALGGPNDLAFGPDGRLYFTDSGRWDEVARPDPGGIFVIDASGRGEAIVELDHVYPNGILVEPDGTLVWSESYEREIWRRRPSGEPERFCTLPEGHVPDGLKRDREGRYWITALDAGGIDVVEPDGTIAAFVRVGLLPNNCVFGGTSLYVTDNGPAERPLPTTRGQLLRLDVGVAGAPLFRGTAEHGFGAGDAS